MVWRSSECLPSKNKPKIDLDLAIRTKTGPKDSHIQPSGQIFEKAVRMGENPDRISEKASRHKPPLPDLGFTLIIRGPATLL